MAISSNTIVWFAGTQTEISSSQTTVANNVYQLCGASFTNTANATDGAAVLKCQFDATMPTVGNLLLFARLMNIQSTNDAPVPDANYPHILLGAFPIDYGVAADVDFYTCIPNFPFPRAVDAQVIDFYVLNNATGQTMGTGWQAWVSQFALGPTA